METDSKHLQLSVNALWWREEQSALEVERKNWEAREDLSEVFGQVEKGNKHCKRN